jgi:uncharacterized membrane protein YtjA (UPF0391 family)
MKECWLTVCDIANGTPDLSRNKIMISYAITFFIIALIAGVLGFWGLAGLAAEIGKILCIVFVVLVVVSLLRGRGTRL